MSFDEFKDGTVGAAPPAWMGGPRDRMRMGDWYGSVPFAIDNAITTAAQARDIATAAHDQATAAHTAATEARDAARAAADAIGRIQLGGIDIPALAAALAPLLPTATSIAEAVRPVVDGELDEAFGAGADRD